MTADDKTLAEQIARAIRLADTGDSLPAGFAARMWDEGVTNRSKEMHLAAAVLPIIRKAQADAWQAGVNFALPSAETTHFARHNPHRTEEDA